MFDIKMAIHTSIHNYDVSLAQYFQKHFSNASCKHDILGYGKHKNGQVKKVDKQRVSCVNTLIYLAPRC